LADSSTGKGVSGAKIPPNVGVLLLILALRRTASKPEGW
jgi:hypothetical protein